MSLLFKRVFYSKASYNSENTVILILKHLQWMLYMHDPLRKWFTNVILLDFYYKYCSIKRTGLTCFKKFLLSVPYKSNKCPGFLSVLVSIKRTGFGDHSYHSFIDKSFPRKLYKKLSGKAFQKHFWRSFTKKLSRKAFQKHF